MAKLGDAVPKNVRKLADAVDAAKPPRVVKAKDAAGHEHGEAGRFVSAGEAHSKAAEALHEHYGADAQHNGKNDPKGMTTGSGRADTTGRLAHGAKAAVNGLLARAGSLLSGKPRTERQRIEDKHTHPESGAVNYDRSIAERRRTGDLPVLDPSRPTGVFTIGGGAVGKGSVVEDYVGNGGQQRKDGTTYEAGDGRDDDPFVAPQPGFHPSRVFDSDAEKKKNPLYSDKKGETRDHEAASASDMYGPSGPKTGADLARYTPEQIEAVHAHVRAATKYKDAHDFARSTITGPRNPEAAARGDMSHGHFNDGTNPDTEFDGGLTHELSSHVVKNKLADAIAHPENGSFVYDSVGNIKYGDWANQALDNGYNVDFAEATDHLGNVANPAVAQYRNQGRERTVDPAALAATHAKAALISPKLRAFAASEGAKGRRITHVPKATMNAPDIEEALNAGMTPDGPPKGFVHPKKAAAAKAARDKALEDPKPSKCPHKFGSLKGFGPYAHRECWNCGNKAPLTPDTRPKKPLAHRMKDPNSPDYAGR
jgi:hypothetical protein